MTVEHDAYVTSRNFNFNCKAIISCCCCCCFFNNFWWRCSGCLQSESVLGFLISCAFVSFWCQWRRGDQEAMAAVVALAAINNTWILQKKIFEKCLRPRLVRLVGRATSYRTTLHICWQSQVNDNDVDAARSLCCRRRRHQFSDENEDHRDDDGHDILANTTKIWPSDFWFYSFSLFEAANDIPAQKNIYMSLYCRKKDDKCKERKKEQKTSTAKKTLTFKHTIH